MEVIQDDHASQRPRSSRNSDTGSIPVTSRYGDGSFSSFGFQPRTVVRGQPVGRAKDGLPLWREHQQGREDGLWIKERRSLIAQAPQGILVQVG